jgi:hypothetical protein
MSPLADIDSDVLALFNRHRYIWDSSTLTFRREQKPGETVEEYTRKNPVITLAQLEDCGLASLPGRTPPNHRQKRASMKWVERKISSQA